LRTAERSFTVGHGAHNAPVINNHSQSHKQPGLLVANRLEDASDVQFALVDLTACYPAEVGVRHVRRAIWLVGDAHLVVRDEIDISAPFSLAYHWHGHPLLYWCLADGVATLVSDEEPDCQLHLFSPQIGLIPEDCRRLPGSRGQQTLAPTLFSSEGAAIWWVFSFAAQRPTFQLVDQAFEIDGRRVPIDARLSLPCSLHSFSRHESLVVTAVRKKNTVKAIGHVNQTYFSGELEYAFYLLVNGHKVLMQWYTSNPEASFTVPDGVKQQSLEIRGFVRERANPKKKTVIKTVPVIEK
jgi:hypothetical protein